MSENEYVVACHKLAIPFGGRFITIPKFPYESGEFVLLNLEGYLIPGRWRPGDDGSNWLELPGVVIELTHRLCYWIVGLVVPLNENKPCLN